MAESVNVERDFGRAFERFFREVDSLNDLIHGLEPDAAARALRWSDVSNLTRDFKIADEMAPEFVALWEECFGSRRFEEIVFREDEEEAVEVKDDEPGHETRPQPEGSANYVQALIEFLAMNGSLLCLQREIRRFALADAQARTLTQAVLISAVGALERAVAEVERIRLRTHVGAMGTGEREFSLDDLIQLGDLDSVIEEAVERRVEALGYGGLEDWKAWFNRAFGVDIVPLALDWARLEEVVQRRHVVAHNDGRVSRLYLKRTGRTDVVVGDLLELSPEYMQMAIDECFVLGLRMVATAWEKLGNKPEHQQFHMRYRCYDMLVAERWQVARCLALDEMERALPATQPWLVARVNEWLARRGLGEEVDEEVAAWDVGALATRFVVAKLALTESYSELRQVLPRATAAREVHPYELMTWPLYAGIRSQSDFPELLEACRQVVAAQLTVAAEVGDEAPDLH